MGSKYVYYVVTVVMFHPTDGTHRLFGDVFRQPADAPVMKPAELLDRFERQLAQTWDIDKLGSLSGWTRGQDYISTIIPA